jgi:hypothetical protein
MKECNGGLSLRIEIHVKIRYAHSIVLVVKPQECSTWYCFPASMKRTGHSQCMFQLLHGALHVRRALKHAKIENSLEPSHSCPYPEVKTVIFLILNT